MLINPGDLIPVRSEAIHIPWTKRKSTILNFLHRGPVTFKTYVYDTNVGDISSLATYFNPERWTNKDLNTKFGHKPRTNLAQAVAEGGIYQSSVSPPPGGNNEDQDDAPSVLPRLLLYPFGEEPNEETHPETPPQTPPSNHKVNTTTSTNKNSPQESDNNSDNARNQQTFEWVINQQDSETAIKPPSSTGVSPQTKNTTEPPSTPNYDDVFMTSSNQPPTDIWNSLLTPHDRRNNDAGGWVNSKENLPEIQRPSDVWRYGSTSSTHCNEENNSLSGGFWAWNPTTTTTKPPISGGIKNTRSDSTSSSSSDDQSNNGWKIRGGFESGNHSRRLGSTGWSSTGPSSVHGSMESLTAFKTYDNEENFLLGESLLQNLTNFKTRNETLV